MLGGERRELAQSTSISASFIQEVDGVAWRRHGGSGGSGRQSTGSPSGPRHPVHIFTSDLNSELPHVWLLFSFFFFVNPGFDDCLPLKSSNFLSHQSAGLTSDRRHRLQCSPPPLHCSPSNTFTAPPIHLE